jgi:hypothetical protein
MTGKELIESCKTPYPYLDDWVKNQCVKNTENKAKAMMYFIFIRTALQTMNKMKLYNLIPDVAKKHIVHVFVNEILENDLIKKGWGKYDKLKDSTSRRSTS